MVSGLSDMELLKAVIEHPIFKLIARGAMVACLAISGWIASNIYGVNARMDITEDALAVANATLANRSADNERFQREVDRDLAAIRGAVTAVQSDAVVIKTDLATVKGILQGIARDASSAVAPDGMSVRSWRFATSGEEE